MIVADDILLLSDMHTMSYWALIHPDYVTKDNVQFLPNTMQDWTFRYWETMCKKCRNVDAVIFNGDLIDGINKANCGAVAHTDVYEQVKMASMLIEMLPRDIPMYFTKGTNYHGGDETTPERIIADKVGGVYSPEGIVEEAGIRIFVNHYIPHAQYKAAGLEKKIKQIAAAESCYGKIDVLYGAHNHEFSSVITGTHVAVMTPGWQHKTPYAIDKNLISPPDIGYVVLHVEAPDLVTIDRRGVVQSPFSCNIMRNT